MFEVCLYVIYVKDLIRKDWICFVIKSDSDIYISAYNIYYTYLNFPPFAYLRLHEELILHECTTSTIHWEFLLVGKCVYQNYSFNFWPLRVVENKNKLNFPKAIKTIPAKWMGLLVCKYSHRIIKLGKCLNHPLMQRNVLPFVNGNCWWVIHQASISTNLPRAVSIRNLSICHTGNKWLMTSNKWKCKRLKSKMISILLQWWWRATLM